MEILDNLKQQYDLIYKITASNLIYHGENSKELYGMSLYSTILENSYACIKLIKSQLNTPIGIILRSLLEASIDLANLADDENYLKVLSISSLKQQIRLLNQCKKEGLNNKFLTSIYNEYGEDGINNMIKDFKDEQEKCFEFLQKNYDKDIKNINQINIEYKFEKANATEIYKSVYNILCRDTHNNLGSLVSRNIYTENGSDYKIQIFKQINQLDYNAYCDSLSGMLMEALEDIYKILNIKEDENFKKVRELRNKSVKIALAK